jgi:hypothetical protein
MVCLSTTSPKEKDKGIKELKALLESTGQKRKLLGGQIPRSYSFFITKVGKLKEVTNSSSFSSSSTSSTSSSLLVLLLIPLRNSPI